MLISRVATTALSSSSFVPGVQDISIRDRQGSLHHLWRKLQSDVKRTIEEGNFRESFSCQILDDLETNWLAANLRIKDDGTAEFRLKATDSPYKVVSLQECSVTGHLTKVLIQLCGQSRTILLNPSQRDFAELYATMLIWSRLRPAGISEKLWYPSPQKLDEPDKDLLRCELKAHFTVYNPQYMRWSPFLARLKRNGELTLSDAQSEIIYSLQVRKVASSRIKVVNTSVVDSRKVILIFPDMGGPDSVYLKFSEIDDFEDWMATLNALSLQQVATPLSRDPLMSIRWKRSIVVKVVACRSEDNADSPEKIDLEDTYVDVCLNRWVFARTCLNSDRSCAHWGQTFELPSPEMTTAGKVAPDQLEVRLKRRNSTQSSISSEKDATIGACAFAQVPAAPTILWEEIPPSSSLKLNLSAHQTEISILHANYYRRLYDWMSDLTLRTTNRLIAALPASLSKLFPIFNEIYRAQGRQVGWISSLASEEIKDLDLNSDTIFRETSLLTRSLESLMQQFGEETLQNTIGRFVRKLVAGTQESLELDPAKERDSKTLEANVVSMGHFMNYLWSLIQKEGAPPVIKPIFRHMGKELKNMGLEDKNLQTVMNRTLSATLFLRFYVPALLNPSLYNLTHKNLSSNHRRTLVLVAKILQAFANGVKFGNKEMWLTPMNKFIGDHESTLIEWYSELYDKENRLTIRKVEVKTEVANRDKAWIERPQKELLVKTFMGQELTSPNLVDEWAAFSHMVRVITETVEDPAFKGLATDDDLVEEIVRECKALVQKEKDLISSLERPDSFEDSTTGPPPKLYMNYDTLLFSSGKQILDQDVPKIKRSSSLTENISRLSWLPKNLSVTESDEERPKSTSSVRRLTQMLRITRSPTPSSSSSSQK